MTYFKVVLVVYLLIDCAISLKCLEGIQDGTCSPITQNETTTLSLEDTTELHQPKALSMVAEDLDHDNEHVFQPTPLPFAPTDIPSVTVVLPITNTSSEPQGRAIHFGISDPNNENILTGHPSSKQHSDLSDVSMENDEHEDFIPTQETVQNSTKHFGSFCTKGGLTYENGEKLENECETICTCKNGKMDCTDRCLKPFIRKGKAINDSLCVEKETNDACCSVLVCSDAEDVKAPENCIYRNKTYHLNEEIEDNCENRCTCETGGSVACVPRCAPIKKSSESCVEVSDPMDKCCKKILCDVTLDDHEPEKYEEYSKLKLLTARFINSTTIKLEFDANLNSSISMPIIEVSENKKDWTALTVAPGGYLESLGNSIKYLKMNNSNDIVEIHMLTSKDRKPNCNYKGRQLKIGEEYNDNCTSLCFCRQKGIQCLPLDCPTYFGVDVLNPNCIEWETEPLNFVPAPPICCPKSIKCKNTGSCLYKDVMYNNWQQIPINVTGCEQRCFCEMGNVECQNICPPVTALPPSNLACSPNNAKLGHLPDDDCCIYWTCKDDGDSTGTVQNNINHSDESASNSNPYELHPTKPPSKILGPLLVYANRDSDDNNTVNESEDENNYYSKHEAKQHHSNDINQKKVKSPPYLGPILPTKTSATNKIVPKEHSTQSTNYLSTTPSTNNEVIDNTSNDLSDIRHKQFLPTRLPGVPNNVETNGNGDADELLQFINQHPELANYPSGSVFEIHNVPPNEQKPLMPQQINPNSLLPYNNNRPVIPYIFPNGPQLEVQPGTNVEHILQHLHKNLQPFIPIPHNSPIQSHNGLLVTSENGPYIPNILHSNLTQPGMQGQIFPGGFLNIPGYQSQDDINVHTLEAIDAHTIRLAFTVPPVIVGLHGRVEVRYTYKDNNDLSAWQLQIFAPPNDLIETAQLEFDLLGLKEDSEYKIKITIALRDLHNTPSSRIYTVRTLKDVAISTLAPVIHIEPNLVITDINATWVTAAWRKFTDYELQFIDGVQIRYREIDGKIYAATPLIHRAVISYTLENLKPTTKYEAGIFFIPFSGQQTELHAENMIHFTTANEVDSYGFNVTLEIGHVKSTSVEITWSGVPYPEDKYVNIYRAIYQSDSGKGDFSTFKLAKRDSPPKATIMDLKPGIRYRLWLEVYLTNGRIKTSNVQDFITRPRTTSAALGASSLQSKLEGDTLTERRGDYYGPLVIVAILAAIAIISTLILLLILVKRHNQNKAAITTPPSRVSQSAYDNPTYKVEIQQETMDL